MNITSKAFKKSVVLALSKKGKEIANQLLTALIEATDSDAALLGTLGNQGQLEPFLFASGSTEARTSPNWDEPPVFPEGVTWGTLRDDAGRTYGWFPVLVQEEAAPCIILLREKDSPYLLPQLSDFWFFSQRYLSKHLPGHVHERFSAMADTLNMVQEASDRSKLFHGLCHYVISRRGLGWDRFWVFEEGRKAGSFMCLTCHGQVKPRDDSFVTPLVEHALKEEISKEIHDALQRESSNPLFMVCCSGKNVCRFSVLQRDLHSLFPDGGSGKGQSFILFKGEPGPVTDKFRRSIQKRIKQGQPFQEDREVYCLPLHIREKRHLAFVSRAYGCNLPNPALVGIFLNHLSRVISEWDDRAAATRFFQKHCVD